MAKGVIFRQLQAAVGLDHRQEQAADLFPHPRIHAVARLDAKDEFGMPRAQRLQHVAPDQHETAPELQQLDRLIQHERSDEHTSELPSLMRISYAVSCLKKTTKH